ncbi:MAG: peptidoglycan recognition family protein, partial [Myxococcota bacterium]
MWLVLVGVLVGAVARADGLPPVADRSGWDDAVDAAGAWVVSPVARPDDGGSRVAVVFEVDDDAPVRIEARGDGVRGAWQVLDETYHADGVRIAVVDLARHHDGAELRIAAEDEARIGDLGWELLEPAYPDAGWLARGAAPIPLPLDPVLSLIGVVDRASWGARATTCTLPEDDWYRMAIHHTAGAPTTYGTVEGAVQVLQAYSQDSGEYCDIPYQFLVGFDGSLWEGRPLAYTSGATGGGNNDGNIAVSFLGCYHPTDCPNGAGDPATDVMIDGAHLLVQTLTRLHGVPSDADSIRGHRDWPGNATACPGDYVYERLDDLRADATWFAAVEVARSHPADQPITVAPGATAEVWIELQNTGLRDWTAGSTMLGTTAPRDGVSPIATASWPAPHRAATVPATVPPGGVGRFTFVVSGDAPGTQSFGLLEEWVTWFADAPWGAGPIDALLTVTVVAASGPPSETETTPSETDPTGDDAVEVLPLGASEPRRIAGETGCGCATGGAKGQGA